MRFHLDPRRLFGEEHYHPQGEYSDSGWRGIYSEYAPQGLNQIVREVSVFGKPIYITENGLPDHDDDQRPRWLLGHLHALHQAIQSGCDVRGFYHWTFTDNFEWSEGWGLRFGLVELDPATQERRPRPAQPCSATSCATTASRRHWSGSMRPACCRCSFHLHNLAVSPLSPGNDGKNVTIDFHDAACYNQA